MKLSPKFARAAFLASVGAIAAVGAITLISPSAQAIGGPQCGPTIFWICTFPDGHTQPFGGTVCQKAAFEKKTGAHCVPGG